MDEVDIFQGKVSSTNTGLVGDNKEFKAQIFKNLEGLESISKIFDIFYTA